MVFKSEERAKRLPLGISRRGMLPRLLCLGACFFGHAYERPMNAPMLGAERTSHQPPLFGF